MSNINNAFFSNPEKTITPRINYMYCSISTVYVYIFPLIKKYNVLLSQTHRAIAHWCTVAIAISTRYHGTWQIYGNHRV